MKCRNCGNENFILTEEHGKINIQKVSIIIPLILLIIGISQYLVPIPWTAILQSMGTIQIQSIGKLLIIINFVAIIIIKINNWVISLKMKKINWIKTSRTKATCTNCHKQYYLNSMDETYTKFQTLHNDEPEPKYTHNIHVKKYQETIEQENEK